MRGLDPRIHDEMQTQNPYGCHCGAATWIAGSKQTVLQSEDAIAFFENKNVQTALLSELAIQHEFTPMLLDFWKRVIRRRSRDAAAKWK